MTGELYNNRPLANPETVDTGNQFEDELFRLIDSALVQAEKLHEAAKRRRTAE